MFKDAFIIQFPADSLLNLVKIETSERNFMTMLLRAFLSILPALCVCVAQPTYEMWDDLRCDADRSLNVDDCSTAFQSSIPSNAYTTTQGDLHATHGGCRISLGRSGNLDILKTVLSSRGLDAMHACSDRFSGKMGAGSATIYTILHSGGFILQWTQANDFEKST